MTALADRRFVSRAPKLGFVPAFDGIRGLGIAMVLYEHTLNESTLGMFSFSPIVDLFFVLSGFLIVTLLLQEDRTNGVISLRKFYMRRGLRLLPSVWLYLVVMLGLTAVFARQFFGEVLKDAAAAFFYVYNLFYPPGTAAFRPDIAAQRAMSQLWTLSLEEQFYLIVGFGIVLCIAKRWVKPLVVLCVVASLVVQWGRATQHFGPFLIAMQRPDGLMLGSALAIVNAHWGDFSQRSKRILKWVASIAVLVGALTMLTSSNLVRSLGGPYVEGFPAHYHAFTSTVQGVSGPESKLFEPTVPYDPHKLYFIEYGHTVVIWMALPFVLAMARVKEWRLNGFLQWRPFMYMGRLSYSLYIWHGMGILFAVALMPGRFGAGKELARAMFAWAVSFGFAIPVYKYVELRFQRIKLGYSAEKTAVDVSTGKEVDTSKMKDPERPG